MNHSPYQDWLFDDEQPLSDVQMLQLHQHLRECAECRELSSALNQMEASLKQKPMAAPAAGFTQRWQARLLNDRAAAHRRQTRLTLGFILSGLATLLVGMLIFLWPWLTAHEAVFWAAAYQLYSVYLFLASVGEFLTNLLKAMTQVIPLVGWVLAIGMVFELGVLWVVSYRLLTNPRRLDLQ
jgi:predicted anti-sigma-YlaC factor YlaD